MSDRLNRARSYFAAQADPYAGGDLGNAQRLGALLWGLVVVLMLGLFALSPPDEAIGAAGWIPAAVTAAGGITLVSALRRGEIVTTWNRMLAVSYLAVIALAGLQWLAGGADAPYEHLLLLPVLFVAMLHPPRRILVFLGFVGIALTAPLVYDGWNPDLAGSIGATFVIWTAISVLGNVLMGGVRAQRLTLAREEAEAREEARVDTLTGLHNRRAFDEALALEVERARRLKLPLTVAMLDVHNFKEINDGWGHAEGDRCLREVAEALSATLRHPDLCFRWGGDEFSIILTGTDAAGAGPLGERLRGAIEHGCKRPNAEPIEIAFAVAERTEGMDRAELVAMAGLALTAAKSRPAWNPS